MNVSIEGHHYTLSDSAKTYITEAVDKFERFYSPIISCHITIRKEADTFGADVIVRVQGQTLKASDKDDKLYKAVDEAAGKMTRQLQKLHDKRRTHRPTAVDESGPSGD